LQELWITAGIYGGILGAESLAPEAVRGDG
jgi:hypothetical protein